MPGPMMSASARNCSRSAYRVAVYGAGLIVGERRGHAARLVGTACERKRDWNRKRNDYSNTRLLKRLPTRKQLGCVLTFVTAADTAPALAA
jgi:hypothetical protein